MEKAHTTEVRFDQLDLHPALLEATLEAGFTHCTPIQAMALPPALAGRDVAGQAQTGTGKTLAFLLATMHHLLTHPPHSGRTPTQPRAVILAPTRELAIQIKHDADLLNRKAHFSMALVYGGVDYEKQRSRLAEGVDILIGTPGRLIDYYKQKVFDLRAVQVVVLDEADRMFDLGFIKDIRYLLRRMPKPEKRLGLLFSATLGYRVTELAYEHMNMPEEVTIEPEKVTADLVTETLYHVESRQKVPLLLGLLKQLRPERGLIFVNTKRTGEELDAWLRGNDFEAGLLSGDVPQRKRQRLIEKLLSGEIRLLVATDVAARGLHIPAVSHVFNFDLPQNEEDYVHRIGRTARAGARGEAISFACERYVYSLPEIEAYIGHKIPTAPVEESLLVEPAPPRRDPSARRHREGQRRDGRRSRRRSGEARRRSGR